MARASIAYSTLQYEDKANWYMKAYEPSTTTPKLIFDGREQTATSFVKIQLNSSGIPISTGGDIIIPYINGRYDLWLFPTEKEANQNDTSSAVRVADDVTAESLIENAQTATYTDNGFVSLLDDTEVNAIYDIIDTGSTPTLPNISQIPDFNALMTMMQRQILSSSQVQVGDGLFTLNDMSATKFVPEKLPFVRADYPLLDAAMGPYIPASFDFTNSTFLENDINENDTSSGADNKNNARGYGLFDGTAYLLRKEKLYIIDVQNLNILHTINVDSTEDFLCAEVVHNKLLILTSKRTSPYDLNVYSLNDNKQGITSKMNIGAFNGNNFFHYSFVEGNNNDVFICSRKYASSATPTNTYHRLMTVIKTTSSFASFTVTYASSLAAYLDNMTFIFDAQQGIFYNKATDEMCVVVNTDATDKSPILVKIPVSQMSTSGITNYAVPEVFHFRLPSIPLVYLESNFNTLQWTINNTSYLYLFNQEKNTLQLKATSPIVQKDSSNSFIPDSNIYMIEYDLTSMKVTGCLTEKNARFAVDDNSFSFNINKGASGINVGITASKENEFYVGNKKYNVISIYDTSTNKDNLMWISLNTEIAGEVDIEMTYELTTGSSAGGSWSIYESRVIVENNQDLFFMNGAGYTNPEIRKFKKLKLIDNTITSPRRPAPVLNAVYPIKGFIKAAD